MSLKDARLSSLREELEKSEVPELPEIVENEEEIEKPKGRVTSKKK